jgi:hypothetical protein
MTGIEGTDTMERERVVGIPRAFTAAFLALKRGTERIGRGRKGARSPSAHKYSRTDERMTARPSARREKGVRPAPFN